MKRPLHELAPTTRFTDRAADYARFRPSYPGPAIDAMLAGLGPPGALRAADIGAGTGISARLLAERGVPVDAVEPNAAMRAAATPHALVTYHDAGAERTGLADGAYDLVLCAQAFHWFRHEEALAEFARILRPGGRAALMWNERDGSDSFTRAYSEAVVRFATDPAAEKPADGSALLSSSRFRDGRLLRFPHSQVLDLEGVLGRALSASYAPKAGPDHERMIEALRAAFTAHADPVGRVAMVHRTVLYLAETPG